jgi:uncharacterized membrane protein
VPGQKPNLREFGTWLARSWHKVLITVLLAPVLGAGIAVVCLAAGVHAVTRSRSPWVPRRISTGETLVALIAAVLPAVVYGCTVWGSQILISPANWTGWIAVAAVAGLVTLVVDCLAAIYILGYSMGVAQAKTTPPQSHGAGPPTSLAEQMLRPFRWPPP